MATADEHLIAWVMERGGPVIRWRTATELAPDPKAYDLNALQADLLTSSVVRTWLDRLQPGDIHSSKDTAFENAAAKLLDFGLRAGMPQLDERMWPFLDSMESSRPFGPSHDLDRSILAWGILRAGDTPARAAGYENEPTREFCLRRLADLARTCHERAPGDIYVDRASFPGIPAAFRRHRLVDPDLMAHGWVALPTIHDLMWMSHLPEDKLGSVARDQVEDVVAWVLRPDCQALPDGYGIMRSGPRRYHAIGWRPDLPGYAGFDDPDFRPDALVLRLELMASFPAAHKRRWLRDAFAHLDAFRTDADTWRLPSEYLREQPNRYGVLGARMGLSEGRRTAAVREVEATFRMARLRRWCGGSLLTSRT